MLKYGIGIYWSEEDGTFVADVPELSGCATRGPTHEIALGNALDAMRLWVDTAKAFGDPIPEPNRRRLILASRMASNPLNL